MPDPIFGDPRLASLYDVLDDDRSDLAAYDRIVEELAASTVLDVGCGTGTFACMLARRGIEVVGLDPAEASLEVARCKTGAERVRWVHGDAASAPPLGVDLAVMTGNVAQVFLTEAAWSEALSALARAIRVGGWLVFEVRDPTQRAWERWTRQETHREIEVGDVGTVETWTELVEVAEPLVSFRHVYRFARDGAVLTSDSTLRFRDRDELVTSLDRSGLQTCEVRDAPDRPGLELVVLARRSEVPGPPRDPSRTLAGVSQRPDLVVWDFRSGDQEGVQSLILDGLAERWGTAFDPTRNRDIVDITGNYVDHNAEVVVVEAAGRLVATGTLVVEGTTGRIVRMSVAAAHRRSGLGRAVVGELVARARSRGLVEVKVLTDSPWASAVALYRACGFVDVARDDRDTHFAMRL